MTQLYPMPCITDDDAEKSASQSTDIFFERVLEAIQSGSTLKDIYGIPNETMDAIYAHAYRFYQNGRMDDAKLFFRFLCTHDIYNADYSLGLAAVCQQKKDYPTAIQLYKLSYAINPTMHRAMFYAGQCYLFLKDKANASSCFALVADSDAPEKIKKQAQGYLNAIKPSERQGEVYA